MNYNTANWLEMYFIFLANLSPGLIIYGSKTKLVRRHGMFLRHFPITELNASSLCGESLGRSNASYFHVCESVSAHNNLMYNLIIHADVYYRIIGQSVQKGAC